MSRSTVEAEAEKRLGNNAFYLGDYELAYAHYSRAIELDPTNAVFFFNRAVCQYKMEFVRQTGEEATQEYIVHCEALDHALSDLRTACELNPNYAKARYKNGEILVFIGRWNDAIAEFEICKQSGEADLHEECSAYITVIQELIATIPHDQLNKKTNLALLEKKVGNLLFGKYLYEDAIDHYSRAIAYCPTDAILYCNRSAAHLKRAANPNLGAQDTESREEETIRRRLHLLRALDDANKSISLNENYAKAHWRRGQALMQLNSFQQAVESLKRASELENTPQIQRDLAAAQKKWEEAKKKAKLSKLLDYEKIVTPTRAQIWDSLTSNPIMRRRLKNPKFREILRRISNCPSDLPKLLQHPKVKTWLEEMMQAIDPNFSLDPPKPSSANAASAASATSAASSDNSTTTM